MREKNIILMGLGLVAFVSVMFTIAIMTYEENNNGDKISFGKYEVDEIEKLESVILFKKTFPHHSFMFDPTSADFSVLYEATDASWQSGGESFFLKVEGKYTYDVNNTRIFQTTEKLICDKGNNSYITITNFVIEDEPFFYENLVLDCLRISPIVN